MRPAEEERRAPRPGAGVNVRQTSSGARQRARASPDATVQQETCLTRRFREPAQSHGSAVRGEERSRRRRLGVTATRAGSAAVEGTAWQGRHAYGCGRQGPSWPAARPTQEAEPPEVSRGRKRLCGGERADKAESRSLSSRQSVLTMWSRPQLQRGLREARVESQDASRTGDSTRRLTHSLTLHPPRRSS